MTELPIAPWRLPRPFNGLSDKDKTTIKKSRGKLVTSFIHLPEWANHVNPGDPVEFVDTDDLQVWMTTVVVSVGKVAIKDIPHHLIRRSMMNILIGKEKRAVTHEDIIRVFDARYPDKSTPDTVIGVVTYRVIDVFFHEPTVPPELATRDQIRQQID